MDSVGDRTVGTPKTRPGRGMVRASVIGTVVSCSVMNALLTLFARPFGGEAFLWLTLAVTLPILVVVVVVELTARAAISAASRYSRRKPGVELDRLTLLCAFGESLCSCS